MPWMVPVRAPFRVTTMFAGSHRLRSDTGSRTGRRSANQPSRAGQQAGDRAEDQPAAPAEVLADRARDRAADRGRAQEGDRPQRHDPAAHVRGRGQLQGAVALRQAGDAERADEGDRDQLDREDRARAAASIATPNHHAGLHQDGADRCGRGPRPTGRRRSRRHPSPR